MKKLLFGLLILACAETMYGQATTQPARVVTACDQAALAAGSTTYLQLTTTGMLCTTAGGSGGGNPAAGLTGSAVPSYADYLGVSVGGNLVGVTGHGTAADFYCTGGCAAGTEDVDDGSIAAGQTTGLQLGLGYMYSGTAWIRLSGSSADGLLVNLGANNDVTVTGTVSGTGAAGTAATGVLTVQGISSMTPLLVTLSGTNTIDHIITLDTITNPVTVTGSVTATITNFGSSIEVLQDTAADLNATVVGTKTNNNAAPSTTNVGALTAVANAAQPSWTEGNLVSASVNLKGSLRAIICDAQLNDRCAYVNANNYLQVQSPPITYNSTQPTLTNGQTSDFQITSRAALIVAPGTEGFAVTGTGSAGTAAAGVLSVQGIASMTPLLVNPGTAANWAVGATGSAVPANAIYNGAIARSSEASAATTGNLAGLMADLVGKLVVLPYANPENFLDGTITTAMTSTTSTAVSGMGAQGGSLRVYVTACTVSNSSATIPTDVLLQDGSGGTTLWTIPGPNGTGTGSGTGGAHITFPTPIKTTANTALYAANVTTGSSTKVSCTGYKGL